MDLACMHKLAEAGLYTRNQDKLTNIILQLQSERHNRTNISVTQDSTDTIERKASIDKLTDLTFCCGRVTNLGNESIRHEKSISTVS